MCRDRRRLDVPVRSFFLEGKTIYFCACTSNDVDGAYECDRETMEWTYRALKSKCSNAYVSYVVPRNDKMAWKKKKIENDDDDTTSTSTIIIRVAVSRRRSFHLYLREYTIFCLFFFFPFFIHSARLRCLRFMSCYRKRRFLFHFAHFFFFVFFLVRENCLQTNSP